MTDIIYLDNIISKNIPVTASERQPLPNISVIKCMLKWRWVQQIKCLSDNNEAAFLLQTNPYGLKKNWHECKGNECFFKHKKNIIGQYVTFVFLSNTRENFTHQGNNMKQNVGFILLSGSFLGHFHKIWWKVSIQIFKDCCAELFCLPKIWQLAFKLKPLNWRVNQSPERI